MADATPILEIELKDAGTLIAQNRREIAIWLDREKEFWEWIRNVSGQDIGLQNDPRTELTTPLDQARQIAAKADETAALDEIPQIQALIIQYAKTGLASKSPRAQFVQSVHSRHGEVAAAAAVAHHLNGVWPEGVNSRVRGRNIKPIQLGRTAMTLFDLGVGQEVDSSYRDSAEQLLGEFAARLREGLQANQSESEALKGVRDVLMNELGGQKELIQGDWKQFLQNANAGMNENIANFQNTEKAYKEQMKLGAAVLYWTGRGEAHKKAASSQLGWLRTYGTLSGIAILAGGACLVWAIVKIVEVLGDKSTTPLLFLGGFALLIASAILWVARLMVRVYFDERRRTHDATERATMAEAYAALTSEGLVSDAERVIVLSSLFRPTGDGSAREDSAPESIQHAILAKLLDQDSGKKP